MTKLYIAAAVVAALLVAEITRPMPERVAKINATLEATEAWIEREQRATSKLIAKTMGIDK